jgi:hypothetical protein
VWGAIAPPENDAAEVAILAIDVIRAAHQRRLERSGTGHFQRPAYRVCVTGAAICIVCIVQTSQAAKTSLTFVNRTDRRSVSPVKRRIGLRGRRILDTNDTKSLPGDISPILMVFKTSIISWR